METDSIELTVKIRRPHDKQKEFIDSPHKRKVIRAGRRGGKTTGIAIMAVEKFLGGKRILYATPTQEQVDKFWSEVKLALREPIKYGIYYKNESRHIISLKEESENEDGSGVDARIRAKTAWNADSLRGDYADELILDEYQLMSEDAWDEVGAPMLADNDGNATFIYTEKRGLNHAKNLYKKAKEDKTGRYKVFNFSSFANPHVSKEALEELAQDMTKIAYKAEILAEEIDDDPDALWKRDMIQYRQPGDLIRVVIGVDPSGSSSGDECGIIGAGIDARGIGYILSDGSLQGSPESWAKSVINEYRFNKADRVVAEVNFGGEMVRVNLQVFDRNISYKPVRASRGKAVRAEPIVAQYEKGKVYHCMPFKKLEDEMCNWIPGVGKSPNRIDALVWALTDLMLNNQGGWVL